MGLTNHSKNLVLEQLAEPATLPVHPPQPAERAPESVKPQPRKRRLQSLRRPFVVSALQMAAGALFLLGTAAVSDLLASNLRVRIVSVALQAAGVVLTVSGLGLKPQQRFIYASAALVPGEEELDWWDGLIDRHGVDAVAEAVGRTGWGTLIAPSLLGAVRRRQVLDLGIAEERRQRAERDLQERRDRQVADDDIRTEVNASIGKLVDSLRPRRRTWFGVAAIVVGVVLGGFPGEIVREAQEMSMRPGTSS